jgi:signal transduction histidine kinase
MFITVKRHQREKQELLGASSRLTDALLKSSSQGLFLLDGKDKILPPVSQSLAGLFRRQDFTNLTFEKLLAPIVTAKTLTVARNHIAGLLGGATHDAAQANPLSDIDVRLTNADGTFDTAHYSFEFDPIFIPNEARAWLVRVTDITVRVQTSRELEDLRGQFHTQGEILRGVLQMGGARFGGFMQKTDASMKTIATVLKKPAREEDAFRHKLDEILDEVDRIRREAAAFKLTALESAARIFEDALHDLRNRSALSGGDFLPLAVKFDQLYNQFALINSLTIAAGPIRDSDPTAQAPRMTTSGTQIIEAPKFPAEVAEARAVPGAYETAPAGSLDSTLQALTDHVAQEQNKQVVLESSGLQWVPPRYQSAIKNVAIQLIRNAVMHGIEPPAVRKASGKPTRGTLRLEFRARDKNFELLFEDDGYGLVPEQVRATAIARGVVTEETAARMRDREAIKLIFKSRYTTLASSAADATHGAGMSLVRRHVHDAGGKIALASLPGYETRFKITLPALASVEAKPDEAQATAETQAAAEARAVAEARAATVAQAAAAVSGAAANPHQGSLTTRGAQYPVGINVRHWRMTSRRVSAPVGSWRLVLNDTSIITASPVLR